MSFLPVGVPVHINKEYEFNLHGHPIMLDRNGHWLVGAESPVDCEITWGAKVSNKEEAWYFSHNAHDCIGYDGEPILNK